MKYGEREKKRLWNGAKALSDYHATRIESNVKKWGKLINSSALIRLQYKKKRMS